MTLLQNFDYLGRARGSANHGTLDSLDTLDSLAQTATALLTASARHRTQAGTGHIRLTRDHKVPCVEEDSGYQTSENEAENENCKENGRETLDLGYERTQGPVRHPFSHHGSDILDLSCQRGENEIATDGSEENLDSLHEIRRGRRIRQPFSQHEVEILNLSNIREEREPTRDRTEENLDSSYEIRRERRIRQPFSQHEVEILNLSNRREEKGPTGDGTEENLDLERERRKQKHTRRPFNSNGGELLDLPHKEKKREPNRDSFSEDSELFNLAYVRREHERLQNILTNKREHLHVGIESRKRELDRLSIGSETVDSKHKRIRRRRTERTISDEGEDILSLGDEEQEERTKRRTGDSIHDQPEDVLSSGHERTERRRTGDNTREEVEDILSLEDEGKEENAEEWDSARGRTKRRTEDSVSDPADDNSNPDDEVDEIKTEPGTEEALDNPLAATSTHSRLRCCNNGFFRATGGTPSVFESNCGCTTHNLVDWRTRVTWTDPNLLHQVRVREVTVLSPFRTSAIPWGLSVSPWRSCPTPQSSPQPQHPLSLPQTPQSPVLAPQPPASAPQQPLRVKKEQMEDDKSVEDDRGYRCGQVGCGRTFCRNEELTRHLRIHSGQRPFVCQRCGRRFVRRDHLTKHQRTHLPTHVKRSYTCPLPACTHRYTRSDALTRHMWTAHHLRARQPTRGRREPREEPAQDPKK